MENIAADPVVQLSEKPIVVEEKSIVGLHALLKDKEGNIWSESAKTRTQLSKILSSQKSDTQVLAVYRGKKMELREKKVFSFS